MSELTLTQDQQNAYDAFSNFILDPIESVFVLQGYSGTGKSTLVEKLIDDLPKILKTYYLINPDKKHKYEICLTATTNKAAENLAQITGRDVHTIHSKMGLIVRTDYKTGKTELSFKRNAEPVEDTILFIDEASYIDQKLLSLILQNTERTKIVFIGDPAQLLTVGCKRSPVFDAGFTTARLEQVVRQADGSPITDLATAFRGTVNTGEYFSFEPDGSSVSHMPRDKFEEAIIDEFTRQDWEHQDSKVLAWTNRTVIDFNKGIRSLVSGDPKFVIGDYAICNQYVCNKKASIKTDQLVMITSMKPQTVKMCGGNVSIDGTWFGIDHKAEFFMPNSRQEWKEAIKYARDNGYYDAAQCMTASWIDLRAAYACTVNKSQGSTYDKVFIDLDDLKKCRDGNQLARMLYVGVSRARSNVILTGDLV